MGCILYISPAFGKMNPTCPIGVVVQISHLFVLNCQVQSLCCVCGSCSTWERKAYTAGSCQCKQGLERNGSSQEWSGRVQLFQRTSLSQLGTLWRYRSTLLFCSYGISGGTAWAGVAKLPPEESLSRGSRVTHFHVLSTFMGCLLGAFSVPSASIPPGVMSVLCRAAWAGTQGMQGEWHRRRVEGWRKRALVNHLKYTITFQGVA